MTSIGAHTAVTEGGSAITRYMDAIVGTRSVLFFLYYEWCCLLSIIPGAFGLLLRRIFWTRLFARCGPGAVFGSNITVRNPKAIRLGMNVVVSEGCVLDGRVGRGESLIIGDDVIIANQAILAAKGGTIRVGSRVGIGAQTVIQSTTDSSVEVGDDVLVGPRCYLVSGGNYRTEQREVPIRLQGIRGGSRVVIGDDVWLGANVSVLDNVVIERGSVCGAGAVVIKPVKAHSICIGVPARVVGQRGSTAEPVQKMGTTSGVSQG